MLLLQKHPSLSDPQNLKSRFFENEYKKYCLKGGEYYYLVDEDFVGCNST